MPKCTTCGDEVSRKDTLCGPCGRHMLRLAEAYIEYRETIQYNLNPVSWEKYVYEEWKR